MAIIQVLHIVDVETENYYLNNLIDYSDKNLLQFSIITFGAAGSFTKQMEERGCKVYFINAKGVVKKITALFKLRMLIKKINADIVHTHLFMPSLFGLTAAKWQKRKTVLTRHHSDALYVIPSKLKRIIWLRLEKFINYKSDHIITPSQMVYDIVVNKENVSANKVSLIPYGQTTERFAVITATLIQQKREELHMQNGISLVCVSRLFNRKGHQYLFDAFANLIKEQENIILYLVGTGSYREVLERMVSERGIEGKVKFLGWRSDALTIMAASDIIVHPSLEDALSSAVIEAIMLAKPIVATDISGVKDTLDNGKYGVIVPPADSKAFEDAIRTIINDMPGAQERAAHGRRYLLEYMSAERVSTAYTNIYQQLIQE
jgi:glycosyltransferase involved in cell wall biosynthesis